MTNRDFVQHLSAGQRFGGRRSNGARVDWRSTTDDAQPFVFDPASGWWNHPSAKLHDIHMRKRIDADAGDRRIPLG